MAIPTLGSVLLGSTDPRRLRAWYRTTFGGDRRGDGPIDFGGTELIIYGRNDIDDKNPEPGRALLNFHVDDARALASRLDHLGVSWLVEVEERPIGLIGTVVDPDGNYVQVVQLAGPDHRERG
jgi:predicted enzyme related to lactoylglutathione lyase